MGTILHGGEEYSGSPTMWGYINGTLSEQADLKTALDAKYDKALANELGAKNLLPNNAVSTEYNGITYTVNTDGTVGVNGSTSSSSSLIKLSELSLTAGDKYIVSGGYSNKVRINIYLKSNPSTEILVADTDYLWTVPTTGVYAVQIYVSTNTSVSNALVKPMMRLAIDSDNTYEPYAKSNRELTVDKCDNSVIAPVENGATASRAYAIGEHFIRDGAFCTAKTAIALGAAFTLGTNYTAGRVADIGRTGWISPEALTPKTGSEAVANYGTMRATVNENLGIASLRWSGNATTPTAGNYDFVLPSKYLPASSDYIAPLKGGNYIEIRRTDGVVRVSLTSSAWSGGTLMYPIV